ncbi:MAG: ActS/PrrB/RegB family redox-sensitive histidine kinase [Alphaproteobacteria bacterium]|jgi:two-component system sensor histidine kinase RegB|nr:ActS/PrrB/RegB family redox-sensitive histidine kinase [Alphaproteobacteria bacterium]MDP6815322.1 ActS/PrrB/RegB family redox-sensitive histidine kinase [Alphaproteobacteria bacterium]
MASIFAHTHPIPLFDPLRGRVRVRTLLFTRWLAVFGQLAALLVVDKFLEYSLPIMPAMAAIACSAAINVWVLFRHKLSDWHSEQHAVRYLAFDLVQLAVLLFLTGGLENPFALLFLVPVTISATILGLGSTVGLWVLAFLCVGVLSQAHLPLPWPEPGFQLPPVYKIAIWVSLILGMAFLMFYAWRVAEEARRMSDALAATQFALSREQEMSALGALAAGAAHELGTPLGTIALIGKELSHLLPSDSELQGDVGVLNGEVDRCREILARLAQDPSKGADPAVLQMPIDAILSAAAASYARDDIAIDMVDPGEANRIGTAPVVRRSPELIQGLGNLIENAAEFATSEVELEATWDDNGVELSITDDGPGFASHVLDLLGDPYISTRPGSGRMGLGVFISKTLLERTGASLHFFNRRQGKGATVVIRWPRRIIDLSMLEPDWADGEGGV